MTVEKPSDRNIGFGHLSGEVIMKPVHIRAKDVLVLRLEVEIVQKPPEP